MACLRSKLMQRPTPMLILVTLYGNYEIIRIGSIQQDEHLRLRNMLYCKSAKDYLAGKK